MERFSTLIALPISDRIYKILFYFIEYQKTHSQNKQRHHRGISKGLRGQNAHTQCALLDPLNHKGHRIERYYPVHLPSQARERVDHRCGVHHQLHPKGNQIREIAVLGRQGGDHHPQAKSLHGHKDHKDRKEQDLPAQRKIHSLKQEIDNHSYIEQHLNAKPEQVGDHNAERAYDPREIDLSEDRLVVAENGGGFGQAVGEVAPGGDPGKVKQRLRESVGGQTRQIAKHKGKNDRRGNGLDKIPERAEDGLFVERHHIAAHKQHQQIPVAPDLAELQIEPALLRGDDQIPIIICNTAT